MDVEIKKVLVDLDNIPFMTGGQNGPEQLTLGHVCAEALAAPVRQNKNNFSECKERTNCARRIKKALAEGTEILSLSGQEIQWCLWTINETIKLPLVVAQAQELLTSKEI